MRTSVLVVACGVVLVACGGGDTAAPTAPSAPSANALPRTLELASVNGQSVPRLYYTSSDGATQFLADSGTVTVQSDSMVVFRLFIGVITPSNASHPGPADTIYTSVGRMNSAGCGSDSYQRHYRGQRVRACERHGDSGLHCCELPEAARLDREVGLHWRVQWRGVQPAPDREDVLISIRARWHQRRWDRHHRIGFQRVNDRGVGADRCATVRWSGRPIPADGDVPESDEHPRDGSSESAAADGNVHHRSDQPGTRRRDKQVLLHCHCTWHRLQRDHTSDDRSGERRRSGHSHRCRLLQYHDSHLERGSASYSGIVGNARLCGAHRCRCRHARAGDADGEQSWHVDHSVRSAHHRRSCPNCSQTLRAVYADQLVGDESRGLVYAAVDSADGTYPAQVVAFDAAHGTTAWTLAVGGKPTNLAISDDGQYLYVGRQNDSVDDEGSRSRRIRWMPAGSCTGLAAGPTRSPRCWYFPGSLTH